MELIITRLQRVGNVLSALRDFAFNAYVMTLFRWD